MDSKKSLSKFVEKMEIRQQDEQGLFNSYFKKGEQTIGFNYFSQEVIILDSFLYELISSKDDINKLKSIHPTFFNFIKDRIFASI